MMSNEKSFREKELLVGELNSSTYTTLFEEGEDTHAKKAVLRNTLPNDRIIVRFNEDDEQIITLEPGGIDQMVLGGINKLSGKKIEAKLATSVPESLRINLFN